MNPAQEHDQAEAAAQRDEAAPAQPLSAAEIQQRHAAAVSRGKARSAGMSADRRREIAVKAGHANRAAWADQSPAALARRAARLEERARRMRGIRKMTLKNPHS